MHNGFCHWFVFLLEYIVVIEASVDHLHIAVSKEDYSHQFRTLMDRIQADTGSVRE
jgi:hypothetical protein